MKKLFLNLVITIFVIASLMQAQDLQEWKWQTPKPNGSTIRWVKIWDANNWYLLGGQGTFMKTTNAGTTWTFNHKACKVDVNGASQYAYDGYFTDMNNGFIACANALIKTTNGGNSFDTVYTSTSSFTLYKIFFVSPAVGYATGTKKLKTTDAGLTWNPVPGIATTTTYDMVTPNDTLLLFASTSGNVIRSTNAGATFANVSTGASATLYKILMLDPATYIVSGSSSAARLSTDAGATWTSINTGLPASQSFYDLDYVSSKLYITGNSSYIYTSTNLGTTWDTLGFLDNSQVLTSTYYSTDLNGSLLLTGGALGLINSRIGTVTKCYSNLAHVNTLYDVWKDKNSGKMIAVGAPSGIAGFYDQFMYSTNSGANWMVANTTKKAVSTNYPVFVDDNIDLEKAPTSAATFNSIYMFDATNGFACGSKGALYKTSNSGVSWDSVVTIIPSTENLYKIDFVTPQIGWMFSNTSNALGTIWKTTDAGANWAQQTLGAAVTGSNTRIYDADMLDANNGYCVNYKPVPFRTTDGGLTWTAQTLSDAFGGYLNAIKMIDTLNGYCAGSSGRIYRTTNGGTNWNVMTPFTTTSIGYYALDLLDSNYIAVGGSSGITGFTTNGGASWAIHPTNGFGTIFSLKIDIPSIGNPKAYAVGFYGGIFERSNVPVPVELSAFTANVNGNSVSLNWSTATETNNQGYEINRVINGKVTNIGFVKGKGTSTQINNYSFTDNNLAAGKYSYQLKQIDFDGSYNIYNLNSEVIIGTPVSYSLSQNYPNPFNPATQIKYSIPENGFVTLKVYNILGKEVATLVNENKTAGDYSINFSAKNLSSGVYFYSIKAGNFTQTKKMTILK